MVREGPPAIPPALQVFIGLRPEVCVRLAESYVGQSPAWWLSQLLAAAVGRRRQAQCLQVAALAVGCHCEPDMVCLSSTAALAYKAGH